MSKPAIKMKTNYGTAFEIIEKRGDGHFLVTVKPKNGESYITLLKAEDVEGYKPETKE